MAEIPTDNPSYEPEPEPRHPWSLGVGSVGGIPIRIHFTFWNHDRFSATSQARHERKVSASPAHDFHQKAAMMR